MEYFKGDYFPLQPSEHTLGASHPPDLFSSVFIPRKKIQNQHPSHPLFMQAANIIMQMAPLRNGILNSLLMVHTFNKSYKMAQS